MALTGFAGAFIVSLAVFGGFAIIYQVINWSIAVSDWVANVNSKIRTHDSDQGVMYDILSRLRGDVTDLRAAKRAETLDRVADFFPTDRYPDAEPDKNLFAPKACCGACAAKVDIGKAKKKKRK